MRLITLKIHRAFPELDRYSHEQRIRFIAAAAGSPLLRALRFAAALLIGFAPGFISVSISLIPAYSAGRAHRWLPSNTDVSLAICGPLLTYITRDLLLRLRVRSILRSRALCAACRYNLIGVRVPSDRHVLCPECGQPCELDLSLNELATDNSGHRVFAPNTADHLRALISPAQARRLRLASFVALALIFLGLPALWGSYELFLRFQARRAIAERPGVAAAIALVESAQPKDLEPDAPDAWEAFTRATDAQAVLDNTSWRSSPSKTNDGRTVSPDFTLIGSASSELWESNDPEYNELSRALALQLVGVYRNGRIFDILDEITARRRAVRPISAASGQPLIEVLLPELGRARQFGRINGARMWLADQAHDDAEFFRAFESTLALARIERSQPFAIDTNVATAIELKALRDLRRALFTKRTPQWLDSAEAAISRQRSDVPLSHAFAGERISALDTACFVFSDPDNVRFGTNSRTFQNLLGGNSVIVRDQGAASTYARNKAALIAQLDRLEAWAARPRWERADAVAPRERQSQYALVRAFATNGPNIGRLDELNLERLTISTMIALERFSLANNAYPPNLESLVPRYLNTVPIDPWSGKPLRYRLIEPKTDPHSRAYLLYSVGNDGTDNNANPASPSSRSRALAAPETGATTGLDIILNEPPP